ncbi:MAG: 1-phosphofructokinase family hexose kinase, partial [Solirubrobacterales bacterium]|nr:1-phosphofructokinase family hexose kinase [Solirubrobacterales bacterium]
MILTVTLNFALDVTYHVAALTPHQVHRPSAVAKRAGGKGVNVARILAALGHEVSVTGLVGGLTGERARAELISAGLTDALVWIEGESRSTVAIVDTDATGIWEPGPAVSAAEWSRFVTAYTGLLEDADAVVLAGSLPPGVPDDAYRTLGVIAADAGVPSVLDASAEALRAGLVARPEVVKPNSDELSALAPGLDPIAAAELLRDAGAKRVVASRGPQGLVALDANSAWQVRPPERVAGNPTGAGDAVVAALSAGLVS